MIKKILKIPLYFQVIIAIIVAIIFGVLFPNLASKSKILGDIFIRLIKMCITPIIFTSIVAGFLANHQTKLGKLSFISVVYFEIITTLALIYGLAIGKIINFKDFHFDLASLNKSKLEIASSHHKSISEFFLNIIPKTIFEAFVSGEILGVLLVSIIFGIVIRGLKNQVPIVIKAIEELNLITFRIVNLLIKLAPIGAFGAMSYTVGEYGINILNNLISFILIFYLACLFFVIMVFGIILKLCKSSIFKLIKHIKEEIFIVFGTCSSETVLPKMLVKMENFGCNKAITTFVLPAGYALNLDGTCIYFTLAIMFISNVFAIDLSLWQILQLMLVLLITSKGAVAVVGSAFITLSATLTMFPAIPPESLLLILGIDRFMSEARAVTNLIGNACATVVINRVCGEKNLKEKKLDPK
jgi:aerobic C4-dicarboxylate transport protein